MEYVFQEQQLEAWPFLRKLLRNFKLKIHYDNILLTLSQYI